MTLVSRNDGYSAQQGDGTVREAIFTVSKILGPSGSIVGDASAPLITQDISLSRATYSAAASITLAASATDVFTITGSANKTIFITKFVVSGTATTITQTLIQLIKRSTADTGGTSTNPTAVPHDSNNAAATATINAYTANPSALGTAVGTVRELHIPLVSATVGQSSYADIEFGDKGQPLTLRGIAQQLAFNLNGVTVTGGIVDISIEWIEV